MSTLVPGACYVSPTGSDSNAGTITAPFKTLAHALTWMQTNVRTCYMRAGTYPLTASVTFGYADSGDTISSYPGEVPVLDGGGKVNVALAINTGGVSNVTINGLTIQNFTVSGIDVIGNGVTITNNTIQDITSPSTGSGGIYVHYYGHGTNISHNLIRNIAGPGIAFASAGSGQTVDGSSVSSNVILRTNTVLTDSGAIYIYDPGHVMTNFRVADNVVRDYGPNTNGGIGIYLDDLTSHVTVTGNSVSGTGRYGVEIHGGNDNSFVGNTFDVSRGYKWVLYQSSTLGNFGMGNNTFSMTDIYSMTVPQASLIDYITPQALPTINLTEFYGNEGVFPFGVGPHL